jgi:Tol biopolymer transport system component
MYFTANTGSGFHIWRQRFPDGTAEQVTAGVTVEEGIAFAPDGRSIVTSVGTRQSTVWIHDSRGDHQITSEGYGLLPTVSPDGRKLYYLVKAAAVGSFVSGALWVADLETGQRHQLLPDFLMKHYDISADGERAVFVAAGDTEQSPVWVGALDGRSTPRRLVEKDGLQAFFSAVGEVTFAAKENGSHFLYRVKEDGSDLHQVSQIFNIYSVSPDGQWATGWSPPNALVAYPLAGGSPRPICRSCDQAGTFESSPWASPVRWSRDGKFMYLQFNQSTYAIPLRPGKVLPPIPGGGFRSEQEVSALPGASLSGPRGVFSGPNPSTYVFTKVATQRNIYRVPVP